MAKTSRTEMVNELVGSAHIFSSVIEELMAEQLRDVAGDRLTFGQLKLLKLVSMTRAASLSDLAAFFGVSVAAASKAVNRLVGRGFLERSEAPDDRRAIALSVTREGGRVLARYNRARDRKLRKVFDGVEPTALSRITELLDRLSASTVDLEENPEEICFRCGIHFRKQCLLRGRSSHQCHFQRHQKTQ
jgi:DNA-binding MarR family transcriptional regulator